MITRYRVGLVGLGLVSEPHLEGYRSVDRVEVVAAAELREDRLQQVSGKWGLRGYTSAEAMLEKERLDIVCILTPARTHQKITQLAADHGVHILCEKPMAVTEEEARAMIAACSSAGVSFCYGASYRFLGALRTAKEMIDDGQLGKVTLLTESVVGGNGIDGYQDRGDEHYPTGGPGGGSMGLVDHGIHLIDLFRWLTEDEIKWVSGKGNRSGAPPEPEHMTMVFEKGAVGQLLYNDATFASDLPHEGVFSWGQGWEIDGTLTQAGEWQEHPGSIRIHGTKGALRIFHYPNKLFLFAEGERREIQAGGVSMPGNFGLQMEAFLNSLANEREPEVTGIDGLRALQALLAVYESFDSRMVVRLGE